MCGICASVAFHYPGDELAPKHFKDDSKEHIVEHLKRRGPDAFTEVTHDIPGSLKFYFCSSVLHLRGRNIVTQPFTNDKKSFFLWNGEIFSGEMIDDDTNPDSSRSDTEYLAMRLFSAKSENDVLQVLSDIKGPYSFIFYEADKFLWFGRDIFGRRSLLWNFKQSLFQLCSLAVHINEEAKWEEVPTAGIFCLDINLSIAKQTFVIQQFPWITSASGSSKKDVARLPISSTTAEIRLRSDTPISIPVLEVLNKSKPEEISAIRFLDLVNDLSNSAATKQDFFSKLLEISDFKEAVKNFEFIFSKAIKTRVEQQLCSCKECYSEFSKSSSAQVCRHSYIGVLFSGGLDSLVIAYLAHRYVHHESSIDLLNVAFAKGDNLDPAVNGMGFDTPDRITGKLGFEALKSIFPTRKWSFVQINVTDCELNLKREKHISKLLYPSCSVLDDSIGCALWFASHGKGFVTVDGKPVPYQSPARILLSGLGADEQLAGYSRHRAVFKDKGWTGLIQEISLELDRIGSRNLGRDDRIIADNGVESRYPFLDENVVSFLNSLPVWIKANLSLERGVGEKLLLRLLAFKLDLVESAVLPKRAIQFGSRIAKLENSKEKGSDVCERLVSVKL